MGGVINYASDVNWVDDVKSSLARGIQSGLLTKDIGKLLVTDIEFDLPNEPGVASFGSRNPNRITVLVDSGSQTSALLCWLII